MQTLLVIEGCDMIGKSTLIKELSRITKIPSYKAKNEQFDFVNSQDKFLNHLYWSDTRQLDLLEQIGFSIIFDRAWPSEYAYSQFYNRKTDIQQLLKNDERYAKLGAKILFCYRNSYAGLQDDLDPNLNATNLHKIHYFYNDFFKLTKCEVINVCLDPDPQLSNSYFDEKKIATQIAQNLHIVAI